MKDTGPRYYLDSNAWIALSKDRRILEAIQAIWKQSDISIRLAFQNVRELLDPTKVPDKHAADNELMLNSLQMETETDGVFVLNASALDEARLGSHDANVTFAEHMSLKSKSINHLRDGVHLVNAIAPSSILITCDRKLRKAAAFFSISSQCVFEWFGDLGLREFSTCESCKKYQK